MIPNELSELDISIRDCVGPIEFLDYQNYNWGTCMKLTSLELLKLLELYETKDSRSF